MVPSSSVSQHPASTAEELKGRSHPSALLLPLWLHHIVQLCTNTVEYAPVIGGLDLDMEATVTRLGAFREAYSIQSSADSDVYALLDETFPFLPEICHFEVVSITKGMCFV